MDKLEFTNRNLENLNRCIGENGKIELMKFTELTNRLFEAINYTRSCCKLNDEILQPFKDFVNANYWEQDNEYICKETNKKEDLDDIIRYWHQEY